MTRTMTMHGPVKSRLDETAQDIIGKPLDRPDGPLKVSGTATYAYEQQVANCAYGFLVRAEIGRGRVTAIRSESAAAIPGVIEVFTDYERFLRNPAQGTAEEAPAQGAREIFYFGQPIAVVVAESFEAARHAAQRLEIDYAPAADGRFVFQEHLDEAEMIKGDPTVQGDLDKAMAEAAVTLDITYTTPAQNSAAMEPHASIAVWEGDRLTLYGSYQMLHSCRMELADALGMKEEQVRLVAPYIGGGFGSKLGITPESAAAALAARKVGRPVKIAMSRQQVFEGTVRRTDTEQRIRLAAGKDGKLIGIGHETLTNNLPGEDFAEPAGQATHFLYGGENRLISHKIVRLNRLLSGSMRAPGEAVGMLALENAMDELAEKLGLDPIELRRRNIPELDPEKHIPYSSRSLLEAMEEGARRFGWEKRNPRPGAVREGEWLIGIGMAASARANFLMKSAARVRLEADGHAVVETDMTDIGTGTYSILRQVAGEMLGLPADQVEVRLGDTDFPPASGSGGSWGAASSGSSVYLACEALREKICEAFDCKAEELTLKDGMAVAGNRKAALTDLIPPAGFEAEGTIEPGDNEEKRQQASFGAHFAEVAVNGVTGEVRVRRMLGVFAAGRILNEKTARSQCLGGMIFGIGGALTEEMVHDPRDGHIVNRDLAEYHVPVNLDIPQIEVVFLEERDDWANPLQAKGIGELGISGAGAAITNAIYNACGVRVRDYPMTLDKIFPHLPED